MKFIPVAEPNLGSEEEKFVLECIRSTWISSTGAFIQKFEEEFSNYMGVKYAISCSNGTAALHLALLALDIKEGDEVILPTLTFISTANVITYVGAKPVFVDSDFETWNINPKLIEEKITAKTKAIIPVHLYGYPAHMKEIMKIAKKYHLYVIEDAAEAHAAKYLNKYVGTLGNIGCFSFFGNKIITSGEGGMLITNSKRLVEKIHLYKNHGMSPKKKYYHPVIGYNYRMTNLQAALGYAQMKRINNLLIKRKQIETWYRESLSKVSGIVFQPLKKEVSNVCWLFSALITPRYGKTRKSLQDYLKKKGIDSRPFFYPITHFPMYKIFETFPNAQRLSKWGINLPSSPNLDKSHISYITTAIRDFQRYD